MRCACPRSSKIGRFKAPPPAGAIAMGSSPAKPSKPSTPATLATPRLERSARAGRGGHGGKLGSCLAAASLAVALAKDPRHRAASWPSVGTCARAAGPLQRGSTGARRRGLVARYVVRNEAAASNPWKVLGLPQSATRGEVKARYHELVKTYHPDVGPKDSMDLLLSVVEAARDLLGGPLRWRVPSSEAENTAGGGCAQATGAPREREGGAARGEADEGGDDLLYTGAGRVQRMSLWPVYRITLVGVEISWPRGSGVRVAGKVQRSFPFKEVRRFSQTLDLVAAGLCDIALDLVWGSHITLERIPLEVAAQMQAIVAAEQEHYLRRRATMLDRCVQVPTQRRGRGRR